MLDCNRFDSQGMSLLFDVEGEQTDSFVESLKSMDGIKRVYFEERNRNSALLMVIMESSSLCNAAHGSEAFCLSCPFNDSFTGSRERTAMNWRLLVKDAQQLSKILGLLQNSGVEATVKGISRPFRKAILTSRQREVVMTALNLGYFDFPRKKDLTHLAEVLSARPSTLSEIIRSAERRMVKNYFESKYS